METEEILAAIQKAAETIATPNCAAWLSVVAALAAVAVAIIVAVRQNNIAKGQTEIAKSQTEIAKIQSEISKQQNKIALFEKRYNVYCEIQKILNLSLQLKMEGANDRTILLHEIEAIYGIDLSIGDTSTLKLMVNLISQVKVSEYQIRQSAFLFSNIEEPDINDLISAWLNYMEFLVNGPRETDRYDKKFIEQCDYFDAKYSSVMENQLNLK